MDGEDEDTEKTEADTEETAPEVNVATEEPKESGNSKRAEALLEKITTFKEANS